MNWWRTLTIAALAATIASAQPAFKPLELLSSTRFYGHATQITAVALSTDGARLVSADDDKAIIVWDATTGQRLMALSNAPANVSTLTFISTTTVLTGSQRGEMRLWNIETGSLEGSWQFGGSVTELVMSPAGDAVAVSGRSKASGNEFTSLRRPLTGERLGVKDFEPLQRRANSRALAQTIAFTADGATVFLSERSNVRALDLLSGATRWSVTPELATRPGTITRFVTPPNLSLSPDGALLAVGSSDGLHLLRADSGAVVGRLGAGWSLGTLRWSADGARLASSLAYHTPFNPVSGVTQVWDVRSGQLLVTVDGDETLGLATDEITTLWGDTLMRWNAVSGAEIGGMKLGGGWQTVTADGTAVLMWQNTRLQLTRPRDPTSPLRFGGLNALDLSLSPDGKMLGLPSTDGTLRLIDTASMLETRRLEGNHDFVSIFYQAAFSPDGGQLAASNADNAVYIWDMASGDLRARLSGLAADSDRQNWQRGNSNAGLRGFARTLAWSPDGKNLAVGYEARAIGIWDVKRGAVKARLFGHKNWVLSLAWRPDGRQLLSAAGDGSVLFWDATRLAGDTSATVSRQVSSRFTRIVAYSPDGRHAASASGDGAVVLWDTEKAQPVKRLLGHTDAATCLTWSADGGQLISGSSDRTLRIWDASSGALLQRLTGLEGIALGVAVARDGSRLIAVSRDNVLRAWGHTDGSAAFGGAR